MALHAYAAPIAEVREDAQPYDAPADLGHALGNALGNPIDEVCTHRVAAVHEDMNDEHRVAVGAERTHYHVARAASTLDETRDGRVCDREKLRPRRKEVSGCRVRVAAIPPHHRRARVAARP
ncbi:MAG TPA: hypothetical protein VEK07_10460 [Polyangiaceae bacterium]|nr:hypothetical protein [Polyangiaceae bacterium]